MQAHKIIYLTYNFLSLGVVNFNHKRGCQKCISDVKYDKNHRRMHYPIQQYERRTDESFRARSDQGHHKVSSIIENIESIDMIYSFPTSDPLHLLELGIMKRCLIRWVFGEKGYSRKWKPDLCGLASRMLQRCQQCMPSDFHRSIRNLDSIRRWKGVEFRTMLLYVGIAVFKNLLDEKEYAHFVTLFCAVQICSCEVYIQYQTLAETCFKSYIKNYGTLYGDHSIGSNVHNLEHVVEDMQRNKVGNLIEISTYKYENSLRMLGLQLKHGRLPLEQISR